MSDQWKPFPVKLLPGVAGDYVRQSASAIGCDPSMVALPMLTMTAATIGNARRIKLKRSWSEPSVVWAAVVADSGSCKSPALEAPLGPIRRQEQDWHNAHAGELHEYDTALAAHEVAKAAWKKKELNSKGPREELPEEPTRPTCRRLLVSDLTMEALAVRAQENPKGLLIVRDELSGWLEGMSQYKGGRGADEAHYLSLHGARDLRVDRKTGDNTSIYVRNASASLTGTIQPGVMRRLMTAQRFESGLMARFLVAMPPVKVGVWTEEDVSEEIEAALDTYVKRLLSLDFTTNEQGELLPVQVPLSPDAKALFVEFFNAHHEEQAKLEGDLNAAWSKLLGYAARLALTVCFSRWAGGNDFQPPDAIEAEDMTAGIGLAQWFANEARRLYATLGAEREEESLVEKLLKTIRRHDGHVSARDLMRSSRRYVTATQAEQDLQRLVTLGYGQWVHIGTTPVGGTPTRIFSLHASADTDTTPKIPEETGGSVNIAHLDAGNAENTRVDTTLEFPGENMGSVSCQRVSTSKNEKGRRQSWTGTKHC